MLILIYFFSNVKFDDSDSILQEDKQKALFFLLTRDIEQIISKEDNNVILKLQFVEYLFYCYNFYIENENLVRFRYLGLSFEYDSSGFRYFKKINSLIISFMMENISKNILSSLENLFLYQKIESEKKQNTKVDLHFLNFLRYTFDSKL